MKEYVSTYIDMADPHVNMFPNHTTSQIYVHLDVPGSIVV